jgi:hypothetical protein
MPALNAVAVSEAKAKGEIGRSGLLPPDDILQDLGELANGPQKADAIGAAPRMGKRTTDITPPVSTAPVVARWPMT